MVNFEINENDHFYKLKFIHIDYRCSLDYFITPLYILTDTPGKRCFAVRDLKKAYKLVSNLPTENFITNVSEEFVYKNWLKNFID